MYIVEVHRHDPGKDCVALDNRTKSIYSHHQFWVRKEASSVSVPEIQCHDNYVGELLGRNFHISSSVQLTKQWRVRSSFEFMVKFASLLPHCVVSQS